MISVMALGSNPRRRPRGSVVDGKNLLVRVQRTTWEWLDALSDQRDVPKAQIVEAALLHMIEVGPEDWWPVAADGTTNNPRLPLNP